MTILRLHPLEGSSLLVLAVMLGLPAVGAHCSGEGFPNRQCRTGCDSNSYSPAPRVDTVQTTPGLLDFPMGVAVSPGGEFALISMFGSHSIVKMDLAAPSLASILAGGSAGFADGQGNNAQFNSPLGMCITPDGSKALVAEYRNNRVRVVDTNTGDVTTLAGSDPGYEDSTVGTSAGFKGPADVQTSKDGLRAYVADGGNHKIRSIDLLTGEVTTLCGSYNGTAGDVDGVGTHARFFSPRGLALTSDGTKLLVTDRNNNKIRLVDLYTRQVTTVAGSGASGFADGTGTEALFLHPRHIFTIAGRGQGHGEDQAVITDGDNHRIRTLDLNTGMVSTFAGSSTIGDRDGATADATFNFPRGLARIPGSSMALVADSRNNKIRILSSGACTQCVTGGETCTQCPAGTSKVRPADTFCTECIKGGDTCTLCPPGSSKMKENDEECTACPEGLTSRTGSETLAACDECAAGYSIPSGVTCTPCDMGFYKRDNGSSPCVACPPHSVSPTASVSLQACQCKAGFYDKGGYCWACEVGTFKSTEGGEECSACPRGKFSGILAATGCSKCDVGMSTPSLGATSPLMCSVSEKEKSQAKEELVSFNTFLAFHILVIVLAGMWYLRTSSKARQAASAADGKDGAKDDADAELAAVESGTAPLIAK